MGQSMSVVVIQMGQMGISAAIGFMLIRALSKEQYAVYSLLNTGIATLAAWSGGALVGIFIPYANRLMSRLPLNLIIANFRNLNRPFLYLSIPVSVGLMVVSAQRNQWFSWYFAVAGTIAILTAVSQYKLSFLQTGLKVSGQPSRALALNVSAEALRFLVLVPMLLLLPFLPADRGPLSVS